MISGILLECVCLSVHLLICPDQDKFPLHALSFLLLRLTAHVRILSRASSACSVATPTRGALPLPELSLTHKPSPYKEREIQWLAILCFGKDRLDIAKVQDYMQNLVSTLVSSLNCSSLLDFCDHWIVCLYVHKVY